MFALGIGWKAASLQELPSVRFFCCALAFFLVVGTGQESHAKRFYVSQADNASDDNRGSAKKPFRTIGYALQQASPGDTVFVRDGDYRSEDSGYGIGVIPIIDKGSSESPIQLRAANGSSPILRKVFVQNSENIRVQGFCLQGVDFDSFEGWQDMPCIVRDSRAKQRPDFFAPYEERRELIEAEFATYLSIVDALDFESAIDVEGSERVAILDNQIEGYWAGIQCRNCNRVSILRNQISHTVNGIFSFLPAPSLTNSRIAFNAITQSLDNGIDVRQGAVNVRVEHNEICFSGRSHISLQSGTERCKVRCNVAYAGGFYSETLEFPGTSAISLNDCLKGNVIEGNWIGFQIDPTNVDGNGVILDRMRDGNRAIVRDNYIVANAGAGVNTTISPRALIKGNCLVSNGFRTRDPLRGAGVKLSRDSDVDQTIVDNVILWNDVGLKASRTIREQKQIDRNFYLSFSAPLIWDSEDPKSETYYSVWSVRRRTGWERRGYGFVIGPRWLWSLWLH